MLFANFYQIASTGLLDDLVVRGRVVSSVADLHPLHNKTSLITARKRCCGKVMFLQVSVILFTGGGVVWYPSMHYRSPGPRRGSVPACTEADNPPPPADGYCCRRCASDWNAFLFHGVLGSILAKCRIGKQPTRYRCL